MGISVNHSGVHDVTVLKHPGCKCDHECILKALSLSLDLSLSELLSLIQKWLTVTLNWYSRKLGLSEVELWKSWLGRKKGEGS